MSANEAWTKFLSDVEQAMQELDCIELKQDVWFRGLTRSNYDLLPSLFRHFEKPNLPEGWGQARQLESDLFYEFLARAREAHGPSVSDWDVLFTMQHFRTPTRLLDWTEVLGIAVYFATLDVVETETKNPPPCVWLLNPCQLNKISWKFEDVVYPKFLGWKKDKKSYWDYGDLVATLRKVGWKYPVAIFPAQKSPRMHAQRAWFTIHGDAHIPINAIERIREKTLRQVKLPYEALPAAREFLKIAGLNHYSLFPDLENLSAFLKEKYSLVSGAYTTQIVRKTDKGLFRKKKSF